MCWWKPFSFHSRSRIKAVLRLWIISSFVPDWHRLAIQPVATDAASSKKWAIWIQDYLKMNHCARSLKCLYIFLWIPFASVPLSSGSFILTRTDGQLQLSDTTSQFISGISLLRSAILCYCVKCKRIYQVLQLTFTCRLLFNSWNVGFWFIRLSSLFPTMVAFDRLKNCGCRAERGLIAGQVYTQHQEEVDIWDPGVISTAVTLHHLQQVVR